MVKVENKETLRLLTKRFMKMTEQEILLLLLQSC